MEDMTTIGDKEKPEDFRYFYLSYFIAMGPGGYGNAIMPQRKQTDGKPDNGCNLAGFTQFLMKQFDGYPVIIMSYYETTLPRYNQWCEFMRQLHGQNKPGLTVHAGGGEGIGGRSAGLSLVKPEDKGPTQ